MTMVPNVSLMLILLAFMQFLSVHGLKLDIADASRCLRSQHHTWIVVRKVIGRWKINWTNCDAYRFVCMQITRDNRKVVKWYKVGGSLVKPVGKFFADEVEMDPQPPSGSSIRFTISSFFGNKTRETGLRHFLPDGWSSGVAGVPKTDIVQRFPSFGFRKSTLYYDDPHGKRTHEKPPPANGEDYEFVPSSLEKDNFLERVWGIKTLPKKNAGGKLTNRADHLKLKHELEEQKNPEPDEPLQKHSPHCTGSPLRSSLRHKNKSGRAKKGVAFGANQVGEVPAECLCRNRFNKSPDESES